MRFSPLVRVAAAAALGVGCGSSPDNAGPAVDSGTGVIRADAGSDTGASGDTGPEASLPFPAAPPVDQPQVVSAGGPVMATPKIVPVFFANDDAPTTLAIADFVQKVGQTEYWKAIVTEYGVGPATGVSPIQLGASDNPTGTIDDTAIQAWLVAKLNANDPAFGTPDVNTLYAIFYPPGVTITLGGGGGGGGDAGTDAGADAGEGGGSDAGGDGGGGPPPSASCTSFGGYHQNVQLDLAHQSLNVAYAVVPRCPSFDTLMGLDVITGAASHEFVEAVTDPFPFSTTVMPGYVQVDVPHSYYRSIIGGTEIGDMCAQSLSSFTKFSELAYTVQRSWSNKAEVAGQDPCVPPLPGEVYFNSAPVLDSVQTSVGGQNVVVKGVQIAVGQSKTVELDLFSDAPTSDAWTVSALDTAALRGQPAQLAFTFDKSTGVNGDKIQMTIKVLSAGRRNRELFVIKSELGGQSNLWFGEVTN